MKKIFVFLFFIFAFNNANAFFFLSPSISIEPSQGKPGDTIVISGKDIKTDIANLRIYFVRDGISIYTAKPSNYSYDGSLLEFEIDPILVTNSSITDYQVYVGNTGVYDFLGFLKSNKVNLGVINPDAPVISSIKKGIFVSGEEMTVSGSNFMKYGTAAIGEFLLNGKRVALSEPINDSVDETSLKFKINPILIEKYGAGDYQFRILNVIMGNLENHTKSNTHDIVLVKNFTPNISSVDPIRVSIGDKINIFGNNFGAGSIPVRVEIFKGEKLILSDTPSYSNMNGAHMIFDISEKYSNILGYDNYRIRVVNLNTEYTGPSYSNFANFSVIPESKPLSVLGIEPLEAKVGDRVYVKGNNFNKNTFIEINNERVRTYYKNLGTISFAVPSKLSPGEHKLQVGQIGKDYQISSNFYFSVLEGVSEFASTTQEYIADDCIDLTYNLRRRHEDKIIPGDVFKLQSFLWTRGYLRATPNGYFGVGTESAVESFQLDNDIRITGEAGPLTRGKIKEMTCN